MGSDPVDIAPLNTDWTIIFIDSYYTDESVFRRDFVSSCPPLLQGITLPPPGMHFNFVFNAVEGVDYRLEYIPSFGINAYLPIHPKSILIGSSISYEPYYMDYTTMRGAIGGSLGTNLWQDWFQFIDCLIVLMSNSQQSTQFGIAYHFNGEFTATNCNYLQNLNVSNTCCGSNGCQIGSDPNSDWGHFLNNLEAVFYLSLYRDRLFPGRTRPAYMALIDFSVPTLNVNVGDVLRCQATLLNIGDIPVLTGNYMKYRAIFHNQIVVAEGCYPHLAPGEGITTPPFYVTIDDWAKRYFDIRGECPICVIGQCGMCGGC